MSALKSAAEPAPALQRPSPHTRRPAPLWLRLAVLGGVGFGLALPLIWSLVQTRFGGDKVAAATAAEDFLRAIQEGNRDKIQTFLPPETPKLEALVALQGLTVLQSPYLTFQLGDFTQGKDFPDIPFTLRYAEPEGPVKVPGLVPRDPAEGAQQHQQFLRLLQDAAKRLDGHVGTVRLQRAGDRWYVWGVGPPVEKGKPQAIRAFGPQKEAPRADPRFEALASLDADHFASSWKVTRDLQNRPAREALQTLARELGLQLAPSGEAEEALGRPVTLKIQDRSRLGAIEEVCRQVGLYPNFTAGGIHLLSGPRPGPVVFVGPFVVEAEPVREFPPHPTGMLRLKCFAAGLPLPVVELMRTTRPVLSIERVTTTAGQDLIRADYPADDRPPMNVPFGAPAKSSSPTSTYETTETRFLKNLFRDLDGIHELSGRLRVPLPTRVAILRFDSLTPGAAQEAEGAHMALQQTIPTDASSLAAASAPATGGRGAPAEPSAPSALQLELHFEVAGVDGKRLQWAAYNKQQELLHAGEEHPTGVGSLHLRVPVDTAALVVKVLVETQPVEYEFQLRDIPLQGRPARQLEPLQYPGHAVPVEVECVSIALPGTQQALSTFVLPNRNAGVAKLRVRNHSQKDIETLEMKWAYLDAKGRPLHEAVHRRAPLASLLSEGSNIFQVPPMIARGHAEVTFPFEDREMPPKTDRITIAVLSVGFADATHWAP
jgi:hypothetical protein